MITLPKNRILLASHNQRKIEELKLLLGDLPFSLVSLTDISFTPTFLEIGRTFEEIARKKALDFAQATGMATIAEDSGLCVHSLDGRPGIYTARYGGDVDYASKRAMLLKEMTAVPFPLDDRSARFVCVISFAIPGVGIESFCGDCYGSITYEEHGENGFGYDPIFLYEPLGCTFAEMSAVHKSVVSHRAKAAAKLKHFILRECSSVG